MIPLATVALICGVSSVLDDLDRLDRALVSSEVHLQEIEAERSDLLVEIAGLAAEQATASVREREALVGYRTRLRALARMPDGARAMVLGGTKSLADYLDAARVLRWITLHDRTLHQRYYNERQLLDHIRSEITTRERRLAVTAESLRQERDGLARTRQERVAFLASLLASRQSAARAQDEKRLAHSAMAAMIRKLAPAGALSESFAENRGKLAWPAAGRKGAGFGDVVDTHFGTSVSHPGLDILAKIASPVQAVAAGNVVFATWLRGYGQLVIIDHGDEFHTLYAHLATVKVAVGDVVSSGAIIGAVGDTGSLTGPHLYFEVRHEGAAQDPTAWLRP